MTSRGTGPAEGTLKPPMRLVAIAVAIVVCAVMAFAVLDIILNRVVDQNR
jgi:hypothetical protein